MLSGVLAKAVIETRTVIGLTCAALAVVMGLFVQILPQFAEGLNEIILQVPFIRTLISGLMGIDVSTGLAPEMLLVVVWSHPVVLTIVWGFALVLSTRLPPVEIERGTIDVLLGWPVSRWALYLSEGLVCVGGGLLVLGSGFLGFRISEATLPAELRPAASSLLFNLINLFATYVAVTGIAQCVSAACDRRGKAMGLAVAILLASYLVQFLSTLWEPAKRVAFASFAHYYQPARVMTSGEFPARDVAVLLASGGLLWGLGGVVWSRRSVLTV